MKKFTNHSPGLRGINVKGEGDVVSIVWLEPGKSKMIDPKSIVGILPDLGEPGAASASDGDELEALRARNAELEAKLAAFDPDGDGQPGGGARQDPPALTGKNKADLLEIAKAEGVEIADDATNAQIVAAIEAKRADT